MKKKIISLVAVLVLASMMLVMFTGCSGYTSVKTCTIKNEYMPDIEVTLYQYYNENTKKYDKDDFKIYVYFTYADGYTNVYYNGYYGYCDYKHLSSGVKTSNDNGHIVETGPTIYITNVSFDRHNGKIISTPKCEIRYQGYQYKADMKNA